MEKKKEADIPTTKAGISPSTAGKLEVY